MKIHVLDLEEDGWKLQRAAEKDGA